MTLPMRPAVDGYGNPVKRPTWQGYTLKDLAEYARTGVPISSVPEGQTGYGLDEVGDASVSHDTSKPFNWKRLVGGALAGLAVTQPGAGVANLGRGFVAGTQWGNEQDQNARRNALTESQIAYQTGRNDITQLEILDYPGKRAAERDQDQVTMDLRRAQIAEAIAAAQNVGATNASQIAENEAQARAADALAWRRRHAPFPGGGGGRPITPSQTLGVVQGQINDTQEDIRRYEGILAGRLSTQEQIAEAGRRLAGLTPRLDSLSTVRDSVASEMQGKPWRRGVQGNALTSFGANARPAALAPDGVAKTQVSQAEYDALLEDNDPDTVAAYYEVER